MKSFESIGLWFLPSAPEIQVPGTLTFSKDGGLSLKLAGTFQSALSIENATYPLIQGVVSESPFGRFITLFQCFATSVRIGMPGISLETIHANHGFAGTDYVDSDAMLFDSALLSFSPLAAWLGCSGLSVDYSANTAHWIRPKSIRAIVAEAEISATFTNKVHSDLIPRFVSFEETPIVAIKDFGHATAREIQSRFVAPLSRLMTFASGNTSSIERYTLRINADSEEAESSRFERLYSPAEAPEKDRVRAGSSLLFTLDGVPGGFESFLQTWFRFVETHRDFCAVYFSYGYERHGYLERRFLFQMLAAGCLVREGNLEDPALKAFEEFRDSFSTAELLATQPYAALALPTAFELAMPTLFAKFVDHHWHVIGEIVGVVPNRFVESLFATFNHVRRFGEEDANTIKGANLYWLLERLRAVITIGVLSRLGFADAKILEIIAENAEMAHLRTIKAPWEELDDGA